MLSLLALLIFTLAWPTYATCPTPPTGPSCAGGLCWYVYTPDDDCWQLSGSVSPTTLSCMNGYAFGNGWASTVSYTFTIGANDPIGNFSGTSYVDFDDPNDSAYNQIEGWAIVNHNGSDTYTQLFSHAGYMGDLSCQVLSGHFSATNGDTVTVYLQVTKWYSNTTIKASKIHILTR
jgi:hypothetical protein